ncbi:LamG-like jellyroll fold domain-containing protein [Rubinisphaera sp.]|uniref:LamG-like jellyroll fold domain-containing protein n=1 Tax=Rubinisphaera sp. TaxID=2024857 RepID=UPI000C0E10FB|nr:LamG-like jellyroll fold domain-containing protein [Rubinisphaera sp.]MBV12399.1 hypothetical protein [Rubinisphaera sp.]HCS50102.1 hypothetical protein [Planctomycetaceae bacterium]|tara:strand:+ start:855 stop:1697 length:843 start_codon:yes stop_codon:yes gene_type:complete
MVCFPCNSIDEISSGGMSGGGAALVSIDTREGGASVSGSAVVSVTGQVWDDFHFVLPLDESGDGTTDEYQDRTRHNLHGTGGVGENSPTLDLGVFCLPCQQFVSRDFIIIPDDNLDTSDGFTVSMWLFMDKTYEERAFFTRGGTADDWNFTIGQSYLNHIWARIRLVGDEDETITHYAFSERLQLDTWYHVSATWNPQSSLTVSVNGVLHASTETPQTHMVSSSGNGGYIGRKQALSLTGRLQEIRLQPVRNSAWLEAEYYNFCNAGFVIFGGQEEAIFV